MDAADKDGWNRAVLLHQQARGRRQLIDGDDPEFLFPIWIDSNFLSMVVLSRAISFYYSFHSLFACSLFINCPSINSS